MSYEDNFLQERYAMVMIINIQQQNKSSLCLSFDKMHSVQVGKQFIHSRGKY